MATVKSVETEVEVAALIGEYLVYGWTDCLVEKSISQPLASVCRSLAINYTPNLSRINPNTAPITTVA